MTQDSASVIDKSDQLGLLTTDMRAEHRIGLPKLVGILHAEGESLLVTFAWIRFEQLVLFDHSAERIACDLICLQQAFFDAESVDGGLVGGPSVLSAFVRFFLAKVRQRLVDGFEDFLGSCFARFSFVSTWRSVHSSNAVIFVTVVPGLNGPPSESILVPLLVEEGHLGNAADPLVARFAWRDIDRTEDFHFEIDRRILHCHSSLLLWAE